MNAANKQIVSDEQLRHLAKSLPPHANRARFRSEIRLAVETYLEIREPPPQDVKRRLAEIVRALNKAEQSKLAADRAELAAAARLLPGCVRESIEAIYDDILCDCTERSRMKGELPPGWENLRTSTHDHTNRPCLIKPSGKRDSIEIWRAVLQRIHVTVPRPPRKSKRGRHAEVGLLQLYGFAPAQQGKPVRWPELCLTALVVDAWEAATGRQAPRTINRGRERRHSLILLLEEILKLVEYGEHHAEGLFSASRAAPHKDWARRAERYIQKLRQLKLSW